MMQSNEESYHGFPTTASSRADDGAAVQTKRLEDLLPEAEKADLITVFLALQRQNYCLVKHCHKPS